MAREPQSAKAAKARAQALSRGGTGGDGRALTVVDNMTPEEKRKAAEAAEEAQLLSFLSRIRAKQKIADEIKAKYDEAKTEVRTVFNLADSAGFKREELNEILTDSKVTGQRKNLAEKEARRVRFRKYVGLPVGLSDEQQELDGRLADTAKDELDHEADGYRAGVAGDEPKPPKECPSNFHSAWMKGYHNGQARNAWALSEAKGKSPMPKPAAVPKAEPAKAEFTEATPDELAQQAGRKPDEAPAEAV